MLSHTFEWGTWTSYLLLLQSTSLLLCLKVTENNATQSSLSLILSHKNVALVCNDAYFYAIYIVNIIKLKICFRINLAKLTWSVVRKPKGKNTMKKKNESSHPGIWTCTPTVPPAKKCGLWPLGHATTTPKSKVLKYFPLPFTLFEPCRAVFIMNSKIHLRKISSKRAFQNHFALSPCLFTLGLYIGRSINGLVSFITALAY